MSKIFEDEKVNIENNKIKKKNISDEQLSISKKKFIIPHNSTKSINNKFKRNFKKATFDKFKNLSIDKGRRFSHAINFNNISSKLSNNKVNITFPKIKIRRMSIDTLPFEKNNNKKINNSHFFLNKNKKNKINQINKINKTYNSITTPNIKKINKKFYNDSSYLELKESQFFRTRKKSMSQLFQNHKKSINSQFLNQENSLKLSSYNKSIDSHSISKDNNNERSKENSDDIKKIILEFCNIHMGKEIEFYCNKCSCLACSLCIVDFHNGHNFGVMADVIDKIRINVIEADKILDELYQQNSNNQNLLSMILNEIKELKNSQESFVSKSFDEIIKKLKQIKEAIIEEFDKKYSLEFKRVEQLQKILDEDVNEIKKTKIVINEILKEFDNSSEVKVLMKKKTYDSFLYWCDINIKRIFKNQKGVKNEMFIDSSIKPIPININELIKLLNSIDPKSIVYPYLNTNNATISDDSNLPTDNNLSRNSYINNSNIKNNNSYTFYNQTQYNNFKNKYNNMKPLNQNLKKNYSGDDIVLPNEMPIKNYEDYINNIQRYYNQEYNNNINYEENSQNIDYIINRNYFDKGVANYNQSNQNILYSNMQNNERISQSNIEYSQQQQVSQTSLSPIYNQQQMNFNSVKKEEEIDNFYNIMKRNNEMAIYCFTNLNYCLLYHIPSQNWRYIPYLNELSQQISFLKNLSISLIPEQKMIFTGGYNIIFKEITNTVFQIDVYDINNIILLKPMKIKRYSHCCVYLSKFIYCIGGYGYNDDKSNLSSSMVVSLKSCEKYDIKKKEWKVIKELNSARACFGQCIYKNNIFVFGGYDNKNILSSIEKYEPITDIWITYHIKLPIKIAELGVININNKYIFILGGIDENKNLLDNVYIGRLDHNFINYSWREGPKLICPRKTGNNAFYWNNSIYVVGGSREGICEKFNLFKQKWEMIKSYLSIMDNSNDEIKIKFFSSELNFNPSLI